MLEGYGEPSMVSEWEICFLGLKRGFLNALEEAESPALLCWTYDGLVSGWGQCVIRHQGESALAVFQTELCATKPYLKKLMRMLSPAREPASTHLKRCLAQLGRMVSGDGSRVRVGPAEGIRQNLIHIEIPRRGPSLSSDGASRVCLLSHYTIALCPRTRHTAAASLQRCADQLSCPDRDGATREAERPYATGYFHTVLL